jgi:hypothetical protein
MKRIWDIADSIRQCINEFNLYDRCYSKLKSSDKWIALCVSMDTLQDTCEALLDFESEGIGERIGEKYLRLYGFFQAVFPQQDAIKCLYENLPQPWTNLKFDLLRWRELRDLRNLTAGHPIETKRSGSVKRSFITIISITSRGFTAETYDSSHDKSVFKDYDLQKLYAEYKLEAVAVLNEALSSVKRWETSKNV